MSSKLDLSKEFIGRRALVTGGSRGIGAAIAQRLLDAGAKVVVAARSRSDVTPAAATFISGDVRTSEGVKAIAAEALAALGGLDILVNNAGGSRGFLGGSPTIPDEEWQDTLALNLLAAVRLTNAVLPALRASKAAAVVNISSTAATIPYGPFAHYCAAKAALDTYSRTLAVELASSGVRVNVVTPGPVATPSADELRKTFTDGMGIPADAFVQQVPLGRLGTTDDVVEVVALLASDRGRWLTGGNYRVDGGMTAR
ncbi:Short-chain dehydrogenase/reductase SDR [Sorangium cellulosum So ce56]|uniref:Short-chain dehydrogenase/reductase SDR n=1 Tax=Sorangium cellulosum (strain So ce56) TaxID=448385 RepID=A9GK44_SORC5|nr:SDR family oxidoreductase [Sorangium cellulosum]CAN96530.1 Short-chain dehydrogenase/reductase SDR [Sorangium cellulosum So ce56]